MSIPVSPAEQPGKRTLVDGFFRAVTYLRVSVTDRCDLRCVYCMSPDMTFLPKKELLTLDELDRVCSAFVARGVRKLRLTGGEPLMRRGFLDLVRSLSRHLKSEDLEELTLTTNGTQPSRYATDLARCGVKRINVSLDTLDSDVFKFALRRPVAVLDSLHRSPTVFAKPAIGSGYRATGRSTCVWARTTGLICDRR
jgi:cyclic pyranopterin phosphate synthase